MLLELTAFDHQLSQRDNGRIEKIIEMMRLEEIELENWHLDEIPVEFCYQFYNPITKNGFDILVEDNDLKPLYLASDGKDITTHSIKDAIEKYTI